MEAEHGAHAGHGALADQLGRTAGERLLGGLEDEPDPATELLHLRQHLGDPKAIAVWTSCPQACITPGMREEKAKPVRSSMGRASRSARNATTGPGEPTSATKPAPARPPADPDARSAKRLGDQLSRVELLVAQFGMTMDLAPQRNRLGCDGGGKGLETIGDIRGHGCSTIAGGVHGIGIDARRLHQGYGLSVRLVPSAVCRLPSAVSVSIEPPLDDPASPPREPAIVLS